MKLIFLGDVCVGPGEPEAVIENPGLANAIAQSEGVVCNFEGPLLVKDTAAKKIGPVLGQNVSVPAMLKKLGVTHLSVANNHILDQGWQALSHTVDSIHAAGLRAFGHTNGGGHEHWVVERLAFGGRTFSLIAAAEREFNLDEVTGRGACIADSIDLQRMISRECEAGNLPLVIVHGGTEYEHVPSPSLRKLGRWLIECGARAVVTHHPHVPGCIEYWEGCPIAYSLGDFWMPMGARSKNSWRRRGYAVQLELDDDTGQAQATAIPYALDYERGNIHALTPGERVEFDAVQAEALAITTNSIRYQEWWDALVESQGSRYLRNYSGAVLHKVFWAFVWRHVLRWVPPSWALRQLNGLQCVSHRELWMAALRSYLIERRWR